MIFQKKIIIGSVMSFIATAVGVIAVFFPDLLNLQKEKMEKIDIFISSIEDSEKLETFLHKNVGKIVDLNLAYCLENKDKSISPLVSVDTRKNRIVLEEYYVGIDNTPVKPSIFIVSDKNEKNPSYSWVSSLSGYHQPEKRNQCNLEGTYYFGEHLSGIFLVELESFTPYQYFINLEPLNKKDLKLRNY